MVSGETLTGEAAEGGIGLRDVKKPNDTVLTGGMGVVLGVWC